MTTCDCDQCYERIFRMGVLLSVESSKKLLDLATAADRDPFSILEEAIDVMYESWREDE